MSVQLSLHDSHNSKKKEKDLVIEYKKQLKQSSIQINTAHLKRFIFTDSPVAVMSKGMEVTTQLLSYSFHMAPLNSNYATAFKN